MKKLSAIDAIRKFRWVSYQFFSDRKAFFLEIVIPLLIMTKYPLVYQIDDWLGTSIFYFIFLYPPFLVLMTAWLQRMIVFHQKRCDLFQLVLLSQLLLSFLSWPPSALFFLFFFIVQRFIRSARHGRLLFLLSFALTSLLIILSSVTWGFSFFVLAILLQLGETVVVLGGYFLLVGSRWRQNPRVIVALSAMLLELLCAFLYLHGNDTKYLTPLVTRNSSVEMISPLNDEKLVGVRAVVPVENGTLIFNQGLYLIKKDGLVDCSQKKNIPRLDRPTCDPESPTICYFPAAFAGIIVADTKDCRVSFTPITPGAYDRINTDRERRFFAATSYGGEDISIIERLGPGELKEIKYFSSADWPDRKKSRVVDIADSIAYITVQTRDNRLRIHSYDIRTGELQTVFEDKNPLPWIPSWHGLTIPGKAVVYTNLLGFVYVLDWRHQPAFRTWVPPIVRLAVYDEGRKLVYLVGDFGFLTILDPFNKTVVRNMFCGLKIKSLYFDERYIYLGSTAGIFRIRIDKALAGD